MVDIPTEDPTHQSIMAQLAALQKQYEQCGMDEFGRQIQSDQALTRAPDVQDKASTFLQTMASNAQPAAGG